MSDLPVRLMRRFWYELLLGPMGFGRPVPHATWEAQYQNGYWDFVYSLDELPHYMVILGYLHCLHEAPAILDVGCGHGRLLELLKSINFCTYLGVDVSTAAVNRAKSLEVKNARFEVNDFETYETQEKFDTIVFNESLYYAKRPVDVLLRYRKFLCPQGSIVLSMVR